MATTVDLYLRVSRVGGRENMISPEEQEKRARGLVAERGLIVGEVLVDLDESGGKWERPGLQEALRRVREGESGGLVVAWLDRLSRDSEHAHRLVREIHEAGGRVYAPDAPADWTSPEGELHAGIMFSFAQYVRQRARAGLERAKERAIAAGIPVATRPPVGYRSREDRRLEPDPATAPTVRQVFERRAEGAGPSELADLLQAEGVATSQGSRWWSKQAVAGLLRSRVYLGELSYGKDRRFVNPEAHEAIVDEATWTAAQHPNGRRLQAPRGAGDYLLTGLVRCAACGYTCQGTRTSRGKRIYRCQRRHAGGECPTPARAQAEPVEAVAERAFWQLAEDRRLVGHEDAPDLAGLEEAARRAERRLEQAMSPDAQDAAGDAWPAIVRERREGHESAVRALGEARAATRSQGPDPTTLREVWPTMTIGERRGALAAMLDAVALRRAADGVELVVFPAGTAPDLSRRGFRREPGLHPLDVPADARVLSAHQLG